MTITHPASSLAPHEVWETRQVLVDQVQHIWWQLADYDASLVARYGPRVIRPAAEQEGHTRQHVHMRVSLARTFPPEERCPSFGLARAALQRARRLDLDPIQVLVDAVQGGSQVKDLAT